MLRPYILKQVKLVVSSLMFYKERVTLKAKGFDVKLRTWLNISNRHCKQVSFHSDDVSTTLWRIVVLKPLKTTRNMNYFV